MNHSCVIHPELKAPLSHALEDGKYGRMFPDLPGLKIEPGVLVALGQAGGSIEGRGKLDGDNPRIPAGWAFLGQFIAHDITRDVSLLQHHANVGELRNFRAPRLDLESVYGAGPSNAPFFYDAHDPDLFLLGLNDAGEAEDLPRNPQGVALSADPRDDTHTLVSQLHVAYLKFHNAIVRRLRARGMPKEAVFEEARRTARWHHQWIVVHEFLPLHVGRDLVTEILRDGPKFFNLEGSVSIPVEFADAAYRFGHPQVRAAYQLNTSSGERPLFPDLLGFQPVTSDKRLDWSLFFDMDESVTPQLTHRLEPRIAGPLVHLPAAMVGEVAEAHQSSLAYRDLERGSDCELPSGEAVAARMGVEPLSAQEIGLGAHGWHGETPLWYYILREAAVRHDGEQLGAVGGRIVAEVLVGLVMSDPTSYLTLKPDWQPVLPSKVQHEFWMADLLRFAETA